MNTLRKKVTHHQCPRQSSSTRLIRPPASCLPLNCRSHNLGLQVPRYLLAPAEEQQQHAAHQLMSSSEMSLPCPALPCVALPFGLGLGLGLCPLGLPLALALARSVPDRGLSGPGQAVQQLRQLQTERQRAWQ
ncbi:hypothetical protein M758_7G006200 [Ceratodon purpureus]|nr:hypothetical protein M758_7G006200 [Ceratodon purpureus]